MKKLLALLFSFIFYLTSIAQDTSQFHYGIRPIDGNPRGLVSQKIVDIDNDGDMDIIGTQERYLVIYENRGEYRFKIDTLFKARGLNGSIKSYSINDIDNDNDLDIILGNSVSGGPQDTAKIVQLENLGDKQFVNKTLYTFPFNSGDADILDIRTKDVNGNSKKDIITVFDRDNGSRPRQCLWFEESTNNKFTLKDTIFEGYHFELYALEDFDLDGDLDILAAYIIVGGTISGIFEFKNNSFSNVPKKPSIGHLDDLYIEDLDNNGYLDIISYKRSDTIIWYANNGNFQFEVNKIITESPIGTINIGDLDSDKDIDILIVSSSQNEFGWIENFSDSLGLYQLIIDSSKIHDRAPFTPWDIDSDGDIDIFYPSDDSFIYFFYENFSGSPFRYSGNIYFDTNQNKQRDTNEVGLSFFKINLSPNGASSFSSNGDYTFTTDSGHHQISFEAIKGWKLSTDSMTYNRIVNNASKTIHNLDFGFYPDSSYVNAQISIDGSFPRCNRITNHWITLKNEGTNILNNKVSLTLDSAISYLSSSINPDTIIGQEIHWVIDSLSFFEEERIKIEVQMPGFNSIGDTLNSVLQISSITINNTDSIIQTDTLRQALRCAYDPNDKRAFIDGIEARDTIKLNDILTYRIRFQNTGNDTAINVMVRDRLDRNLDWTSFNPISSSHPMKITIENDGEIVFQFDDIFLVDSTTNEPESHGFIKYAISPESDLLPNIPIQNSADIYFDFNPAIITDTTLNRIECFDTKKPIITAISQLTIKALVEGAAEYKWFKEDSLLTGRISDTLKPQDSGFFKVMVIDTNGCKSTSDLFFYSPTGLKEINTLKANIYPNPFNNYIVIQFDENLNSRIELSIIDIQGRAIRKKEVLIDNKLIIHRQGLPEGIYVIILRDQVSNRIILRNKLIAE